MALGNGFGFFQSIARFMLVWTEGRATLNDCRVRNREVVEQLLQCVEQARANGSRLGHSFLFFTIAEDQISLGDYAAAEATLETTWAEIQASGEGFFAAEYFRLKGLCALQGAGDTAQAEASLRQASEQAGQHQAHALGLRALNDLAGLLNDDGRHAEAQSLLQQALANIVEKAGSADVLRGENLLKASSRNNKKQPS